MTTPAVNASTSPDRTGTADDSATTVRSARSRGAASGSSAVSYTHLDVYKRQGGVSATLDNPANGDPLVIVGEVLVPVTFVLAARPGTALSDVHAIGTHTHAWAQVRGWVSANRPAARFVQTLSTASAAAALDPSEPGEVLYQACVCAPIAAATHGLTTCLLYTSRCV